LSLRAIMEGMTVEETRTAPDLDGVGRHAEPGGHLVHVDHACRAQPIVAATKLVLVPNPVDGHGLKGLPGA
jgi:hypothetical protein